MSLQEHRDQVQLQDIWPEEDDPEPESELNSSYNASNKADDTSWERFHAKDNATAKFYKERRCICR